MFLACLRGLLPKGHPGQPWRSEIRSELVLTHLAAELDAEYLRSRVALHSSVTPVLKVDAVKTIVEDLQNELEIISRLREIHAPEPNAKVAGRVTVEGMFKLYQAMLDAGAFQKLASKKK